MFTMYICIYLFTNEITYFFIHMNESQLFTKGETKTFGGGVENVVCLGEVTFYKLNTPLIRAPLQHDIKEL